MIYQTDFRDNMKIYNEGCLMMSLLEISQRMCGERLTKEKINFIYTHLQERRYMREDCFVKNHAAIINEGLSFLIHPEIRAKYVGAHYFDYPEKSWGAKEGDYIIIQVQTVNGNGHFRMVDYNPWQPSPNFKSIRSVRYYSIA